MSVKNSNKEETIYLLLGSNMGDRMENLLQAKLLVKELGRVIKVSSIYRTKAWGNINQDDFLNQALAIISSFSPVDLLKHLKEIERKLGRAAVEKWAPRIIDIDILFYSDQIIQSKDLTIPHPFIAQRRFALTPLAEIAAHLIHPELGISMEELLERCPDTLAVKRIPA